MTARFIVADVFDGLASLDDGSIDLVITSPPFLALRSYLPADHPDKGREIGSEATPAEFIDTLLAVTAELRRVLAPHGSICVELGDTYAGSGGAGGDYLNAGLREGQPGFDGSAARGRAQDREYDGGAKDRWDFAKPGTSSRLASGDGWPLAKSRTLIPQLYEIALAYGFNPLTGAESPAGRWRIRNVVTWARPNPPVGALGDKWRPATSDVVVACLSGKRYWDDLATRRPIESVKDQRYRTTNGPKEGADPAEVLAANYTSRVPSSPSGPPLLDYWEIPPGGYKGAHYAVFPPALVEPLVKAMCPEKVCRECGKPSRRIVEKSERYQALRESIGDFNQRDNGQGSSGSRSVASAAGGYDLVAAEYETTGWTDCGHDNYRPGTILDPFAGSGTTLVVATGHGHDAIGIDLDPRNLELSRDRVGPFFFDEVTI